MPTQSPKKLIIFDLDGTLIDSIPDLTMGIDKMLAHFNIPPAGVTRVQTWVGNGSLKLVERALVWAKLPAHLLKQAHSLFLTEYATCHDGTIAYHGVTEGLHRLAERGLILALCTNKPSIFLPNILSNMGWTNTFACVLGGDSLPVKKPDPTPLLHICNTLDIDKSQAVMVGDSVNDIQAGKNATITTLALSYGYNYGQPIADSNPDGVFDEFGTLVDFILQNLTD